MVASQRVPSISNRNSREVSLVLIVVMSITMEVVFVMTLMVAMVTYGTQGGSDQK